VTRAVNTNVLLYAISSRPEEAPKAEKALALLTQLDLALSVQVLQEFYIQATRASSASPLSHETAVAFISTLLRFPVQEITVPLMHAALASRQRWGISYWDAAIIEAARAIGCGEICSQDFQHGQDFGGVRVIDPFR
jgi:predicted nucleic acid-binding protein